MNEQNLAYLFKHTDILSLRDLSNNTIKTYKSYLSQFIEWTEANLDGKPLSELVGRVDLGDYAPPSPSQIRTCGFPASGSSQG